jgi:hypothetical protein
MPITSTGAVESLENQRLLKVVHESRRMLELLLGQRITFRDKKVAHTGTIADTEGSPGGLEGYLAGGCG